MNAATPSPSGDRDLARLTPYELVFIEGDFESRVFPSIQAEASQHGIDPLDFGRFAFLTTASDAVRDLVTEDAPPDALEQYRALLFHAFNFWEAGRRFFVLDRALARFLVEASPSLEGWEFRAPAPAGYVQLPTNLFWSSISPDTPPEPVDGFFFAINSGKDPLSARVRALQLLLVLGIRRDRAGFSVVRLETLLDQLTGPVGPREGVDPAQSAPFASVLPGGDLAGLYSIVTVAEALELARRTLWYIDRFPETRVEVDAQEPSEEPGDPPSSRLACVRVRLVEEE